jgi:DNA modification methylase
MTKLNTSIPTTSDVATRRQILFVAIGTLIPDPDNPRKHGRAQISAIAKSIEAFGFNAPILVDKNNKIVAGHGRYEAAKLLGLAKVPIVSLSHLTKTQAKAYMLADNKLTDRSTWDDAKVAVQLKELSDLALDFDIEAIGFELPEIDFRIQSLDASDAADHADEFEASLGPAVSMAGDLWLLGPHRLYCGHALDAAAYAILMETENAAAVFADPPYNVKIDGNVSGHGSIKHPEFAMATGEMTEKEFTDFLTASLTLICTYSAGGALVYACMDWRHMGEMLAAGRSTQCELLNLCVWAKNNGGLGSLYRSQHELVFVFKNGRQAHLNNIQFGRFGRNRTNVWNYIKVNGFARNGCKSDLELHPTVKPIALVADAILDSTKRNDIVLDPFIGSGTTILAAERTGRRCFGIEIDGRYVDTAIARWERLTKQEAKDINGKTFAQTRSDRGADQ